MLTQLNYLPSSTLIMLKGYPTTQHPSHWRDLNGKYIFKILVCNVFREGLCLQQPASLSFCAGADGALSPPKLSFPLHASIENQIPQKMDTSGLWFTFISGRALLPIFEFTPKAKSLKTFFLLLTLIMMHFSMKYVGFGLERAEGFGPQIDFRMNSPLLCKQTGIWRILLLIVSDNMFTFKDRP